MNQKKTAYLGLFAAIAIIFGYVESLIPFFAGIPGMKLGLANLAVLFVLERYTWKEAALVSIVRIFIIGFMFGSGSSIMYSLAGATLSLIVMVFVKNKILLPSQWKSEVLSEDEFLLHLQRKPFLLFFFLIFRGKSEAILPDQLFLSQLRSSQK